MNVGSQNHGIKDGGISFDATRDTMTGQGKHFKQGNGNASKKTTEIFQANAHAPQEPTSEAQKDVLINERKEFGCGCVDEEESNDLGHGNGCSASVVIDQIRMEQNDDEDDKMLCPGSRVEDASTPSYIDSEQKLHETEGNEADRPNEVIKMQRISQARTIDVDHDTKGNADKNKINPTENKVRRSFYKAVASIPTSPQLFQRRRREVSMFEIQPSTAAEAIEIQNICIENGAVQTVRESALILPELIGNVKETDGRGKSNNHDRSRRVIADAASDCGSAPHEKIRSTKSTPGDLSGLLLEGNKWTSPLTKTNTTAVQSCPSTPLASPRTRRKSLGVLTTAAWGMTTYRDKNAVENTHRSPRRRSLAASHGVEDLLENSRKPFWNINQTKNSSDKNQGGISKLSNESITIRKKQRDREETKLQEKSGKTNAQEHISEQENLTNPDKNREECQPQLCSEIHVKELICERKNDTKPDVESDKIRPRLRSRSLEDYRLVARQGALEGRGNRKRKDTRRKSFEMWLSDKEKQTIQKLNILTLEKHQEAEKGAGKRQQRKAGKTYEEWMNDKATAETRRRASLVPRSDTSNEANGRQRIAQARYEKWLSEKETQALEKERLMVKEAERKTMEMRKKYEEKKKNLINEGKHSAGSVCG